MKSEELLRHLNSVDDKYIDELFTDSINDAQVKRRKPRWGLVAACLAVVMIGGFAAFGGRTAPQENIENVKPEQLTAVAAKNSVIMIDVNPSISLNVDKHGNVSSAKAENEDAASVLEGLELKGMDYESAVQTVVRKLSEKGYLTELKNSLLITVVCKNEEASDAIRDNAVTAVTDSGTDYALSVLSQIMTDDGKYADDAEKFGVSTGRMWLIEKTNAMNSELTVENLITQTVHTLNQLYEYTGLPELVERVGNASGTAPKACIEKMGISKLSAEELVGLVKEVSDFYDEWDDRSDADNVIESAYNSASNKSDDAEEICYIVEESLNLLTKAGKKIDAVSSQNEEKANDNKASEPAASQEPIITAEDVTEVADFVISIVEYFD